ncbi:chorismate lyase [Phormidium tenue FACHB-886]|nr:chorismate lyase [Phormidium tenue FACHB-886]
MTPAFKPPKSLTLPTAPTAWYALHPLWQGNKDVVQRGLAHQQLAPTWQMLLLGDGSPTRQLQLLTGEPTEVDVLEMAQIDEPDGAPEAIEMLSAPLVRRQVWLQTASGQRTAYATSWWVADRVDEFLHNQSLPIGLNVARSRKELYRDIQGIHYGHSAALELAFGYPGPFWGRHYLFWHQGQPITLIYEVFSPYLTQYLGPTRLD